MWCGCRVVTNRIAVGALWLSAMCWLMVGSGRAGDQPARDAASAPVKIDSEPRTIDPTEVLPKPLTARTTVDFSNSSLRELVKWLEEKRQLVVLLDKRALAENGIAPAEPISDRLDNEPLYLLLNRLRSIRIAWYYDNDVVHLTSAESMDRLVTMSHDVSALLTQGYSREMIEEAVVSTMSPDSWEETGNGDGTKHFLGDVLFIRQGPWQQLEIRALLQALARPAERTYVLQPRAHLEYLAKLDENADVDFREVPLSDAIDQLGRQIGVDLRLDVRAIEEEGIRVRQPVTLTVKQRKLRTILDAMLLEFDLTWKLENGALWITTRDVAGRFHKTAVYDVRDLCRDQREAEALLDALESQTSDDYWSDVGSGDGRIVFARPGTMVVYAVEPAHDAVLQLLRSYRQALTRTRPRAGAEESDEVTTVYYRVPHVASMGLHDHLPELVGEKVWKLDKPVDGAGSITILSSKPRLVDSSNGEGKTVVPYDVLVIRHRHSVQREIAKVIERVLKGDQTEGSGGAMGGGGFGGGLLRLPHGDSARQPKSGHGLRP